nr:histone-lysine N-methyltransferase ATXR4 isoform X1 [Ipomoea batatas]
MLRLVQHSRRCASQFKILGRQPDPVTSPHHFTTTTSGSQPTRLASPPPIQVGFTEFSGRGVFATRRIGAGELIHTAKPIVSHPSLSSLHSVCYFCLRKLRNQNQSPAQNVSFCSEQCREQSRVFFEVEKKSDWSAFHEYCSTQGLKYPLLVKRLACMIISGVTSADALDILQPTTLTSSMIALMEKELHMLRSTFADAQISDEQMAFLTSQWYTGVLARIRINAFRIELAGESYEDLLSAAAALIQAEAAVGNAIYLLPSLYNHDCDPNTHIVWVQNVDAKLKALRDIEAGEELRICYIDASMDHNARQTLLYEGFGFKCRCSRCMSDE